MSSVQATVAEAGRFAPPLGLAALKQRALLVGGIAAALCLVGAFLSPAAFFRSYLVAYVFVVGIAVGCQGGAKSTW